MSMAFSHEFRLNPPCVARPDKALYRVNPTAKKKGAAFSSCFEVMWSGKVATTTWIYGMVTERLQGSLPKI